MSAMITDNFRTLYNDIKEGISILIQSARNQHPSIDQSILKLKEVIEMEFGNETNDATISSIANLLSQVSVIAYLQGFDNDKNFDKLKEKYIVSDNEGEDEDSPKEGKKFANVELDFKFGFSDLVNLIQCGVELMESNEVGESTVEGKLTANLLSNIREVSPAEYLSEGYIEKDLALVTLLCEKPDREFNEDVINFILSNHDLKTLYSSDRDSILGVYKYAFQDSFGLRPYTGVLSFKGNSIYVVGDDYHLSTIPQANSVFKKVALELYEEYKVEQSDSRQFDFDTIVNSSKPVYFPKKILEYALGRKLTYELSLNLYRPIEEAKSWEHYEKVYVKQQIDSECLHSVYKSLERNLDLDFNSNEFIKSWNENKSAMEMKLSNVKVLDKVKADMRKVVRSMCTGVVVTSYNSLNDSVNSIALRVTDVYKNISLGLTGSLFGSFSSNESISFQNGTNLTEGRTLADGETPLPFNVVEFRHDFNTKLTEAEPLFGYTAVELFRQRGIPIEWGRILLGEDVKGTPIFADLSDRDGIPLQANAVHNMMAGSRSGKGVMTMNILSVGLGSEKPIFYIDRKPDMAVMFHEMTDGNMFIVNGGQYLSKNDPRKVFCDTGSAIAGWESAYDSMPKYLKKIFSKRTYVGDFGDYVYFRAMLFSISLILARAEFASDANIYNKLGGDNGVIFVFDEFKNWQEKFEQKFLTPNGVFSENRLDKTTIAQYTKNKYAIEDKIDAINSGDLKPERVKSYERDVQNLKKANSSLIKPNDIYGTTVMNKFGDIIKAVSTLLSAGFKDGEAPKTDIFVIGQHIQIDGFDGRAEKSGTYPERESGKFNCNESTKGKSLMRGLLDAFFHDWFMGYNQDDDSTKKYMGAGVAGSKEESMITKRRFWGYSSGSAIETLRTSAPANTIYFKPYLVLNNHLEDDPKNPQRITDTVTGESIENPDYSFVAQCRKRVNEAVPDLWETVRKKHIISGHEVTDENKLYGYLNPGIGFEGLASAICQTQGKELDKATSLRASADIANYVANQMGYSSYKELLFDFTPKGLFNSDDMIYAIRNGAEAYKSSLKERLPLFTEYNLLDTEEDDDSSGMSEDYASPVSDNYNLNFGESASSDTFSSGSTQYNESFTSPQYQQQSQPVTPEDYARDYYSTPIPSPNTVKKEDNIIFTKDMALNMIRKSLENFDNAHPDTPISHVVTYKEIDELADLFVAIVND